MINVKNLYYYRETKSNGVGDIDVWSLTPLHWVVTYSTTLQLKTSLTQTLFAPHSRSLAARIKLATTACGLPLNVTSSQSCDRAGFAIGEREWSVRDRLAVLDNRSSVTMEIWICRSKCLLFLFLFLLLLFAKWHRLPSGLPGPPRVLGGSKTPKSGWLPLRVRFMPG